MTQDYQWFVEPVGSDANVKIGNDLAEMQMVYDINIVRVSPKRLPAKCFRVPYAYIDYLEKSKRHLELTFNVWNRRGEHGVFRKWKFGKKKSVKAR